MPIRQTDPLPPAVPSGAGEELDLTSLRMFRLVVDLKSFSAAATRLGVMPGTVSKHIAALERLLGARLLQRTTRRLQVTEAGELLYGRCTRILEEADQAREDFAQLQGEPSGTLRVSIPTVLALRYLSPRLPEFLRRHPRIRLDLVLTADKVDFVAQGIDAAVRFGEQTDPNVVCIPLCRTTNCLVGSPDYFRRHGRPRVPGDLEGHNCLNVPKFAGDTSWQVGGITVRVRGNLSVDNGEVTRQSAVDGLGIAMLPGFIVEEDLQAGRLERVLGGFMQGSAISVVLPVRRYMPAKVRALVDFLKEVLGGASV